jgi:hypothetical protein
MQQEASARTKDQPPAVKNITKPFDIRFPNLSPPVVEVHPRIQVEMPGTYQVHPPQTCRDILRVMSIQKNFENDKKKAETNDAGKKKNDEKKKIPKKKSGAGKKKI